MDQIEVTPSTSEVYKVGGMSCSACAGSLESALRKIDGIESVNVNFATERAAVKFNSNTLSSKAILKASKSVGFTLSQPQTSGQKSNSEASVKVKKRMLLAVFLTLPIFFISMVLPSALPGENWIMLVLSAPVVFYSGSPFISNALLRMRHLSTNMDTLIFIGTQSAFWFSVYMTVDSWWFERAQPVYFESAAVIVTFVLVGKFVEARSKGKAAEAVYELMTLQPEVAVVYKNGQEIEVAQDELAEDDIVVVRPGERLPVDGIVIEGHSSIDEKMFTGEPIAASVGVGDKVMAGSLNIDGRLHVKTTRSGQVTYLSKIVQRIEEAQSSKAPVQALADKVSSVFVPSILIIAALTFVIWFFIVPGTTFSFALSVFVAVLIIACPCALGLATPTAMAVAIGTAAKNGIFIKNTKALQAAADVTDIVLDKTGTLTVGSPVVEYILWDTNLEESSYEQVLMTIASQSNHPLAKAIAKHCTAEVGECTDIENFPGRGVFGKIGSVGYRLGSSKWLQESAVVSDSLKSRVGDLSVESNSMVWLVENDVLIAVISLKDQVKTTASELIRKLHEMGLRTHMLTGDRAEAALSVAHETDVQNWESELLPEDKANYIQNLQSSGRLAAMVGDGINDGPALSVSAVSIALSSGEDLTKETADITLSNVGLAGIPSILYLSNLTMKRIKQNLWLAFLYNVIAIPIAAGVLYPWTGILLSPMIAGGAMALSSLSVVSNSLRLKYVNLLDR